MKKIIFMLILMIASVYAKPCTIDIYFGNGVWNTRMQGISGMKALRRFMQDRAITPLSIEDEKNKFYEFKHAYNPSYGTNEDLIETFYQLKESGQISNNYFLWIFTLLNGDKKTEPYQKLQDIIRTHNEDTMYMFTKYENSSFDYKKNVLLVAHSQGNLFGNKMYTLMNDAQKKRFRMVSVATPADNVAGKGPYVTAVGDYVIGPIPGSLPGNVDGTGHTFIGTYLNGSIGAPRKIALYVKSAYDDLMKTTSCSEYWAVTMKFYSEGYMEVFGSPIVNGHNVVGRFSLGKVNFHTYPTQKVGNPPRRVCTGRWLSWGLPDSQATFGYTELYNKSGSNPLDWVPGTIYDKESNERRKDIHYTIRSQNKLTCIELKHEGKLYDLVKNTLDN